MTAPGLLVTLATTAFALAADRTRTVDDHGRDRHYAYVLGGDSVAFDLPLTEVQADLALSGAHPVDALVQARGDAVRAWAATRPDLTVDVTVHGNELSYAVSTTSPDPGAADAASAAAQRVSAAARAKFLGQHGYEEVNGLIRPAHARLVVDYAAIVAPVAAALTRPGDSASTYAARALTFVQAIPYESHGLSGDTYRRPLAVIDGDRGDCDSKAVLYLALVRSAFPDVGESLYYIPNHLYVGLDLPGTGTRITTAGRSFLVAEPAGPAQLPIGALDSRHQGVAITDSRVVGQ